MGFKDPILNAELFNWDTPDAKRIWEELNMEVKIEGIKHDQEKPRLDLIPQEAILSLGEVLSYGQKKYGDRNWEQGMDWGRPFAAAMRHLWSWWSGEETDPESGLSHLSHALANIAFLATYKKRNVGKDTRSTKRVSGTTEPKSNEGCCQQSKFTL